LRSAEAEVRKRAHGVRDAGSAFRAHDRTRELCTGKLHRRLDVTLLLKIFRKKLSDLVFVNFAADFRAFTVRGARYDPHLFFL